MDTQKFGPPLALSLAIASVLSPGLAGAQSSLQVYSDDFGGPNQSAPAGATRDTVISMSVPRLHAVIARLRVVEGILGSHPIPPHRHPHTHPTRTITIILTDPDTGVPETVDASVDESGQVTVPSRRGISFMVDTVAMANTLHTTTLADGTEVTIGVPGAGAYGSGVQGGQGNGGYEGNTYGGWGGSEGGGFSPDGNSADGGHTDSAGFGVACFAAGAKVAMADGTWRAVEDLVPGDQVRSPDGAVAITRIYADAAEKSWVTVNGEEMLVTASHPVSTQRGFVPTGALRAGDAIDLEAGGVLLVESVRSVRETRPNFNLETLGHSPYWVDGVLFGSYASPRSPESVEE